MALGHAPVHWLVAYAVPGGKQDAARGTATKSPPFHFKKSLFQRIHIVRNDTGFHINLTELNELLSIKPFVFWMCRADF